MIDLTSSGYILEIIFLMVVEINSGKVFGLNIPLD